MNLDYIMGPIWPCKPLKAENVLCKERERSLRKTGNSLLQLQRSWLCQQSEGHRGELFQEAPKKSPASCHLDSSIIKTGAEKPARPTRLLTYNIVLFQTTKFVIIFYGSNRKLIVDYSYHLFLPTPEKFNHLLLQATCVAIVFMHLLFY